MVLFLSSSGGVTDALLKNIWVCPLRLGCVSRVVIYIFFSQTRQLQQLHLLISDDSLHVYTLIKLNPYQSLIKLFYDI